MEKPAFENYDIILNNFDAFCDEFETRAAEAFLRGDQNNGKIVRGATEKLGGKTPSAVAEIRDAGAEGFSTGETDNRVPSPPGE